MPRSALPGYAELHCRSNFSFLCGASHPEELVERALALGYSALAITDECSLAGVVRAHVEARRCGLHLLIGAEMRLTLPDDARTPHARWCCSRSRAAATATCRTGSPSRGAARRRAIPRAPGRRRGQGARRADARRPARLPRAARARGDAAVRRGVRAGDVG